MLTKGKCHVLGRERTGQDSPALNIQREKAKLKQVLTAQSPAVVKCTGGLSWDHKEHGIMHRLPLLLLHQNAFHAVTGLCHSVISVQQGSLAVTAIGIPCRICMFTTIRTRHWHSADHRPNPAQCLEIKCHWNTVVSVHVLNIHALYLMQFQCFREQT